MCDWWMKRSIDGAIAAVIRKSLGDKNREEENKMSQISMFCSLSLSLSISLFLSFPLSISLYLSFSVLPREVAAAATPTKEWKAATVWGSSVGPTLDATVSPTEERGSKDAVNQWKIVRHWYDVMSCHAMSFNSITRNAIMCHKMAWYSCNMT